MTTKIIFTVLSLYDSYQSKHIRFGHFFYSHNIKLVLVSKTCKRSYLAQGRLDACVQGKSEDQIAESGGWKFICLHIYIKS